MRGKVFAVSGASSGLGRALALALARDGVLLSLLARDERRLQNTADECATIAVNNPPPHIFTGDIRGERECQQWITAAAAHFGRLDGLINNAGISMQTPIAECADLSALRPIMDTGFWGAAQCARAALPHLRASGGMIVNISSVQGKTAIPQHSVYAASKHAMEGFFSSMMMEETKVHFLSVRPGWITGTRINENRIGKKQNDDGDSEKQNREGLDVDCCAKKIIKAIQSRREVLTIPARYKWLPILSELFPAQTRRAIQKRTAARYFHP